MQQQQQPPLPPPPPLLLSPPSPGTLLDKRRLHTALTPVPTVSCNSAKPPPLVALVGHHASLSIPPGNNTDVSVSVALVKAKYQALYVIARNNRWSV